jgi:Cu+-exporting ATPase
MELQSPTAVKITPVNVSDKFNPLTDPFHEDVVDTNTVKVGDMVKVIRGASVPADGVIVAGDVSIDESMVTGESVPVLKTPGSTVLGGTICVEAGVITDVGGTKSVGAAFVEVTGVGSSTALAQIVQLVQQAQTRAVPIQSFADQVSAVFVPAVCTFSLLTYMVWYALCSSQVVPVSWYRDELGESAATFSLMFAIACLVISCPCALGLATPTAVMVGTGVGARCGVLMKGGEALEIASKVDSIIFDKTGTLTMGSPAVSDFVRLSDVPGIQDVEGIIDREKMIDDHLLWLLGSLERTSEHPLAKAIVTYAEERLGDSLKERPFIQPTEFRALTGRGASGIVDGTSLAVGNRSFAGALGLEIPPDASNCMKQLEGEGKTAILAAVNQQVVAVLGVADEIKSDAAASIQYLRDVMKIDVWMVTGDNSRTAQAVSRQLGMSPDRVISEALPAAKLQQVSKLQEEGRVVAMIGDGVNDSPALAQADVGISLGTGAEIANEASDMVLVKGHVADVCAAFHLSRAIFNRIRLNLLFSLLYNVLGIPIAAGVFYPFVHARLPPAVAALAMALSSVSVVLSSLSLRLYKPPTVVAGRRRTNTLWARTVASSRRNSRIEDSDDLRVDLLSNDHMGMSEATAPTDNRTFGRIEEG